MDNIDEGKIDLVMKIAASCHLPLMFKVVILVVILVIKLFTLYALKRKIEMNVYKSIKLKILFKSFTVLIMGDILNATVIFKKLLHCSTKITIKREIFR